MKLYFESYEYLTEEDLLEASAKTDFRDKFGQQALNNFDKARDRLRNNGMSVDYGQYLKMTPDELDNLILSLYDDKKDAQKKRVLQGKDKEIRGKYDYLGQYGGFKIYEPLDVQASMDLGVNTGWCTTGRYGHAGHPEYTPSIEDAEEHFDDYTGRGIRLFYFLNPKTMYGEYAIAVYPYEIELGGRIVGNCKLKSCNFEIFNSNDDSDYSLIDKLPLEKLPIKLYLDATDFSKNSKSISPDNITSIGLLSIRDAEELVSIGIDLDDIFKLRKPWWLKDKGENRSLAADVNYFGSLNYSGGYVDREAAVRPVLTVSDIGNIEMCDTVSVFDKYWYYIGKNKLLCVDEIAFRRFDSKSNDYESSEIKHYLNSWLAEQKRKYK